MELRNGLCINYSGLSVNAVEEGNQVVHNFSAPEGHQFVMMLIGLTPNDQPADIGKMVGNLGLISSNGVAQEMMRLNSVIADLQAQLAAKGKAKA
jgi:hypothetical protein